MEIEKRHKIATLVASLAGIDDPRFKFAGYDDDVMAKEVTELASPSQLAKCVFDLEHSRKHGVGFSTILHANADHIPKGYAASFETAYADLNTKADLADNLQLGPNVFDDGLPSITSVMSHIEVEREK
jgi:hypothetical protein